MVAVHYSRINALEKEYTREFEDVYEARKYYNKLQHIGWYIVSFDTSTDYEYNVMKGYYK